MFKNTLLSNPTFVIKAGSSALAKHSAFQALINGKLVVKGAADLPAITSTIADDFKKVYFFYMNAAGTVTIDASDAVALAADIEINTLRNNELALRDAGGVLLGWVVVINESGSTFTGGTTALDAANVTTYYHNAFGLTPQDVAL